MIGTMMPMSSPTPPATAKSSAQATTSPASTGECPATNN